MTPSSKTFPSKKAKKISYIHQAYIFKRKKKLLVRQKGKALKNASFHLSYQVLQKSIPLLPRGTKLKKEAHVLRIRGERFLRATSRKESPLLPGKIKKISLLSKKVLQSSQIRKTVRSRFKKGARFFLPQVIHLKREKRKLSGRQRKFSRILPSLIYRKRRKRRAKPDLFNLKSHYYRYIRISLPHPVKKVRPRIKRSLVIKRRIFHLRKLLRIRRPRLLPRPTTYKARKRPEKRAEKRCRKLAKKLRIFYLPRGRRKSKKGKRRSRRRRRTYLRLFRK